VTRPRSAVTSTNGPLRFNVMNQGLVSVFGVASRAEVTSFQTGANVRQQAPLNLNQGVQLATTPAPTLFLTNPTALAWRPDGSDAWVAIQNSDLVVRLTVDANGIPTVSAPRVAGPSQLVRVDLEAPPAGQIAGNAPRGIVLHSAGTRAFVSNLVSRSVTVLGISNATAPAFAATFRSTAVPLPGTFNAVLQQGQQLFYTGRGPNGRMAASWGGCIVCHPNGRSDNVTWMFDAGPRQTIALDGTFSKVNPFDQRILNRSAVRDEVHDFELNTRNVFGGQGLIDDDRLFFPVGGASGAGPTDSGLIEEFQQFTGAVGTTNDLLGGLPLPTLLGARRDFAMATLNDGRTIIIGGRSGPGQGSLVPANIAVLEFNPRKQALVARSSTGFTLRHSLGAAAVRTSQGNRIYAIGGYASTSASVSPVATVEEYNPATGTWRTVASLPTALAQFGIAVAGGINTAEPLQLIHVVSGNTGSESAPSVANPSPVQRFLPDPAGPGTWSADPLQGGLRPAAVARARAGPRQPARHRRRAAPDHHAAEYGRPGLAAHLPGRAHQRRHVHARRRPGQRGPLQRGRYFAGDRAAGGERLQYPVAAERPRDGAVLLQRPGPDPRQRPRRLPGHQRRHPAPQNCQPHPEGPTEGVPAVH
jgi:hypothetical protein